MLDKDHLIWILQNILLNQLNKPNALVHLKKQILFNENFVAYDE